MNLIFIYGPPASGKMTVAKELSKLTGYKILDNHTIIDVLAPIFPFDDPRLNEIRQPLARKIRLDIFREAAKANVNLITTFGSSGDKYFEFYRQVIKAVEEAGGRICFVQLMPSKDALQDRVASEHRQQTKLHTIDDLESWLRENPTALDVFPDRDHPSIDNTALEPETVAQRIKEHFALQ